MRIILLFLAVPATLVASEAEGSSGMAVFDMINAGGLVAYAIILVSIVCMTLALQLYLRLKQERASIDEMRERFQGKNLNETQQAGLIWAKQQQSLVASTLRAGLEAQAEHREAAVQDEAGHYSGDLFRRADYLLFIGNTAPMLGLLGTVFGMMTSFNVLATQGGVSDPGELAGGISGALVTTCMGLIVALPALIFYTMLRNRIEVLIADVGRTIEYTLFPERRRIASGQSVAAATNGLTTAQSAAESPVSTKEETKSLPKPAPVKKVYMPQQELAEGE